MAEETTFFAHGSRWVRADFHLHTRQDKEFKDAGSEQDFVSRYIAALKQENIHVGVITNHNKFDREEFKALRKAAKKENIYLLPGVELSIKDGSNGIHTLVVFHEDWIDNRENADHINSFLGLTFAGQTSYDNSNARSNHDLLATIRELDKLERDYLLIFAHVEAGNALWGGLNGGRITEVGRNELFRSRTEAFQKVRTRELRLKVQGWLGGWYPAEVEGSDPKSMDEIGRGEQTFIKMGAFTFEAVQFALKPGAERLSGEALQKQAHSWVRSVRFEGDMLGGRRVDFSSEMNCLIGVRGSGKSAVLECLRYALEFPIDEATEDFKYKQELVRFALGSGGKVVVEAEDAQGRRYEIRRILNERSDVYFEGDLKPGVRIPVKNPLFFGQKELVKRGEGSERELVERLLGSKLDAVRREIPLQRQRQRVLDVLANLDKLKDLDALEQEYQNKKKDTEFRLELFRKSGIEQQLQPQLEFNADVTNARRAVETAEAFIRASDAFLREQDAELAAQPRLESKENADVIGEIDAIFERIRRAPEKAWQLLAEARTDSRTIREKLVELERRRETRKDDFAAIERKLSEQLRETLRKTFGITSVDNVRPDDFVKLNAELQKAKMALNEIAKSRTRKNSLRDELLRELKRLSDLWHQEFKEIEVEIRKLNDSQNALKIIPIYKGDKTAFVKELQTVFRGSKLRETTLRGVLDQRADFISVYETLDTICSGLGESGDVFRRYFNENKASLLTWQVPNLFQIEYHGKPLGDHSLGQRASALILFILSQRDNDVIVIDQPEDDLDNQTIFEDVIKLIRTLKKSIQFIFATHNANFPVLGDAEQVGACSFAGGSADIQVGSIDEPEIQKAIVSIMEGGHEAFARRKEIYQLWKQ